jgi:hypothetical protein
VLPVDGYSTIKTTKQQIHDLLTAQQHRNLPSFYCCTHGTVQPKTALHSSSFRHNNDRSLFDLVMERSNYLCSRKEIHRSSAAPTTLLFGDKRSDQEHEAVVMSGDEPTSPRENHIDSRTEHHDIRDPCPFESTSSAIDKEDQVESGVYDTGDSSPNQSIPAIQL